MAAADRSKMSVMLTSNKVSASVKYYTETLGFELKESWPNKDDPQWANLVYEGQSIMVGMAVDPTKVAAAAHGDAAAEAFWTRAAQDFKDNKPGVGIQVYVEVADIDSYAAEIKTRGADFDGEPKTQFYGIRDLGLDDPDGYRIVFFSPVAMESCQSCGMPLADAKPGQMYCAYCTTDEGTLQPYERIFEGTVTGYFMGMQKMERAAAEAAAKEHLSKMPAWSESC
jgi:uncharacterized glyoxalase superfamily protein PhnB